MFSLMDPGEKTIYFSNAGHNAPLWIRNTGKIVELEKNGPPLGMIDDLVYGGKKFYPQTGDRLLIYSDGLVESENRHKEQFTLERVQGILSECGELSCQEIVDRLSGDLEEHTDHYRDDVSMILLEMP